TLLASCTSVVNPANSLPRSALGLALRVKVLLFAPRPHSFSYSSTYAICPHPQSPRFNHSTHSLFVRLRPLVPVKVTHTAVQALATAFGTASPNSWRRALSWLVSCDRPG